MVPMRSKSLNELLWLRDLISVALLCIKWQKLPVLEFYYDFLDGYFSRQDFE